MDRLFGKLQLGTIKVGERSSFPPDGADAVEEDGAAPGREVPMPGQEADSQSEDVPHSDDTLTTGDSDAEVLEPVFRPGYGDNARSERGEILKVSSRSRPSAVAGAIAGVVREAGRAEVQAIGAGAVNQAVKAVAIARDYLRETNIEAVCLPGLVDLTIDDADRTAVRLVIEPR